ncbi:chromosome segregation protein SMC [Peptococcaceae bacterium 1198_IL3148]
MLKRLDIQGFKSFADKTKVTFKPGLTVVVGPNGSGKSNISDAINWVLGEQRASALRGAKMDDVIFAGSDKRRGVGMCEVSLTLDNSQNIFPIDYSEMTITRRIFRSGESQFMINKVPCRLKDIHNLLMDTGIGKGAYSIIGQGKVDEILHNRPEERRMIIEEAAGIVKYRRRKEEAQRKLTNTEQDLLRLGDIIAELHDRLEPLQQEAAKAQKWHGLVRERRQLELGLLARELIDLEDKLSVLGEQLKQWQQADQQRDTLQDQNVTKLENQLLNHNMQLEQYRAQAEQLKTDIQTMESQVSLVKERQSSCRLEYQRIQQQRAETEQRLQQLKLEREQEQQQLQQLKSSIQPKKNAIKQLNEQLELAAEKLQQQETLLEDDKAQIIDLMNNGAQGRAALQRAEERKASAEYRLSQLRQSAHDATLEQNRLKEQLKMVREETIQLEQKISTGQQKIKDNEELRRQIKTQLNSSQETLRDIRGKISEAKSRHRVLVETQEGYSGYQRGVREVLLAIKMGRAQLAGICGTVAELIKVPMEYELAIETALGGALQNLVTEKDTDARQVIEYLKKNKLGRVTFLPLNTLRPSKRHPLEQQALHMPGVMGVAADLIKCDPRYQVVVEFLLGKVLVVNNIDHALKAARTSGQRLRLVTLEGESIYPGGSLAGGGSAVKSGGLLKARREREEYAQRIAELQQREQALVVAEQHQAAELNGLELEIDGLKEQLVKYQVTLAGKKQELIQLEDAVTKYGYRSQENTYEINNLQQEITNHDQVQELAAKQVAEAEGKLKQVQDMIQNKQQQLLNLKAQCQQIQDQITAAKVELAGVEQQQSGLSNLVERLNQENSKLRQELALLNTQEQGLQVKEQQLQQQGDQYQQRLIQLQQRYDHCSQLMQTAKEKQAELQQALEQARIELQQLQQQRQQQLARAHNLQLQQARLETEKQAILQRLEQDFNIENIEELTVEPVENLRQTKNRIAELKNAIETMGSVNPMAEQEYQQVFERYDYLHKQKQDLDESKQSLQQLISEMDQLMSSKFVSTFQQIEKEFGTVFKELFGGGSATLRMVGDNPLTAGIDIDARPPGKKLQNIGLLSGGERSLTAIALLFAILRIKPSPFCVLDEIDAALDEANVDRFAEYLSKFSQRVPFVVISHRKGTMERADTIYGVTMGNTGISKIFSIELTKAEAAVADA